MQDVEDKYCTCFATKKSKALPSDKQAHRSPAKHVQPKNPHVSFPCKRQVPLLLAGLNQAPVFYSNYHIGCSQYQQKPQHKFVAPVDQFGQKKNSAGTFGIFYSPPTPAEKSALKPEGL